MSNWQKSFVPVAHYLFQESKQVLYTQSRSAVESAEAEYARSMRLNTHEAWGRRATKAAPARNESSRKPPPTRHAYLSAGFCARLPFGHALPLLKETTNVFVSNVLIGVEDGAALFGCAKRRDICDFLVMHVAVPANRRQLVMQSEGSRVKGAAQHTWPRRKRCTWASTLPCRGLARMQSRKRRQSRSSGTLAYTRRPCAHRQCSRRAWPNATKLLDIWGSQLR